MKLQGKVALITGAGNGIGAATAILFTELGATVALFSTTEKTLRETASECEKISKGQPKPLVFVGSVTDATFRQKVIEETVKKFGKLDILVNNAGITKLTHLLTSTLADFDEIFDVNVRSVIHLTQLAAPHLMKTKGSIINISSVAAYKPNEGRIFYGMSKCALNHFTRFAAQELGKYQVRVNSVSPGLTRTNFLVKNYGFEKEKLKEFYDKSYAKQSLQRCGEPREVASSIAFLASDQASFITGSDMVVDGGWLINDTMAAPTAIK